MSFIKLFLEERRKNRLLTIDLEKVRSGLKEKGLPHSDRDLDDWMSHQAKRHSKFLNNNNIALHGTSTDRADRIESEGLKPKSDPTVKPATHMEMGDEERRNSVYAVPVTTGSSAGLKPIEFSKGFRTAKKYGDIANLSRKGLPDSLKPDGKIKQDTLDRWTRAWLTNKQAKANHKAEDSLVYGVTMDNPKPDEHATLDHDSVRQVGAIPSNKIKFKIRTGNYSDK